MEKSSRTRAPQGEDGVLRQRAVTGGCRDGDIRRHRDRRGGALPCPRTAGAAAVPTHDQPSRRRTSRAWIMCGGKMCFRGSTMTNHAVWSRTCWLRILFRDLSQSV